MNMAQLEYQVAVDVKHGTKKRVENRNPPTSRALLSMWFAIILATVIAYLNN
jgi:hypothetical protein